MRCRKRGCGTVLSKVANLDDRYCLKHQKEMAIQDSMKFSGEENENRWKKGVQVSTPVEDIRALDHIRESLKGKKVIIKEGKDSRGYPTFALFRYS